MHSSTFNVKAFTTLIICKLNTPYKNKPPSQQGGLFLYGLFVHPDNSLDKVINNIVVYSLQVCSFLAT